MKKFKHDRSVQVNGEEQTGSLKTVCNLENGLWWKASSAFCQAFKYARSRRRKKRCLQYLPLKKLPHKKSYEFALLY